jgi:dihydrodipicolinate synthase/N-acetylneuraminate lyase
MNKKFEGVYSILPTPMKEDGSLDLSGMEAVIEHNIKHGVNGIVVLGSNGEFPYLSFEEKKQVMQVASKVCARRVPLIIGASGMFTREVIELARLALENQADAILSVLPSYYPLNFPDILAHYKAISESVNIPVFYYHFPEASGTYIKPEEFVEILKLPGVVGAKNSYINIKFIKKLMRLSRGLNKAIFTGAEFNLKRSLELGAFGSMGPLANVWAEKVLEIFRLTREGKKSEAEKAQRDLFCLMPIMAGPALSPGMAQILFKLVSRPSFNWYYKASPNLALLKEALRQLGLPITATVRAPLPALSKKDKQLVEKALGMMQKLNSRK